MSLKEEKLSAIEAVYEGRAKVFVCLIWDQALPFFMDHELGGYRAVIIVSALVAILSSSTSVSKDNIGIRGVHLQRELVLLRNRGCYNC